KSRSPHLCRLALFLSAAGLTADLVGISLWILVGPGLDGPEFELVEKTAVALIFFLAKVLYTLSGVLLTAAGAHEWPRWLVGLSAPVWISGAALAAATLVRSAPTQTSALFCPAGFFIFWVLFAGGWFLRQVMPAPEPALSDYAPDPRD